MNHIGLSRLQQIDLAGVDMDAMSGDGPAAQNAKVVQAVHHSLAVLKLALRLVRRSFRDVDVEPCIELRGGIGASRHGLVADSERGMQPEETS